MKRLIPLLYITLIVLCTQCKAQEPEKQQQEKSVFEFLNRDLYNQNNKVNDYDVHFYHIKLDATNTSTYIKGSAITEATILKDNFRDFILELSSKLSVSKVTVDGNNSSFAHKDNTIEIPLTTEKNSGDNIRVEVHYSGTVTEAGYSSAYSSSFNAHISWTLSEAIHARDWWPCKQVLSDKADSTFIYITVPRDLKVASNGLLVNTINKSGNMTEYQWETRYPMNYYLASMAISNYDEYTIYAKPSQLNGESIPIQNFILNKTNYLAQHREAIDKTADLINFFSDKFGIYPFYKEKYGNALAYFGGGMEHQTMTTIKNFNFTLNAHELAHQWFGNHVTCKSWQDIWINEGFASYAEYMALKAFYGENFSKDWIIYAQEYAMEKPNGSVFIPFEELTNETRIFNGQLSYKKGAAIIHTLRWIINDDSKFFESLKTFLNRYGNSVASGQDFIDVVEEITGKDLTNYINEWYYGKGYPYYTINWSKNGSTLKITLNQTTSSDNPEFFTTPVEILIKTDNGNRYFTINPASETTETSFQITGNVTDITIDPNNYIIDGKSATFQKDQSSEHNKISLFYSENMQTIKMITPESLNGSSYNIINTDGRKIHQFTVNSRRTDINSSGFMPGIYFIISNQTGKNIGKFITVK
jgi:aminopeptidase N